MLPVPSLSALLPASPDAEVKHRVAGPGPSASSTVALQKPLKGFSISQDRAGRSKEYMIANSYIVRKLTKDYPDCPIAKWIKENANNLFKEEEYLTYEKIAQPSFQWLTEQAAYYQKRYGIDIRVTSCEDFGNLLCSLNATYEKSGRYVGIIVGLTPGLDSEHLIPIVLHFGKDKNECLISDAIGPFKAEFSDTLHYGIVAQLEILGIRANNVIDSEEVRLADSFSCRLDSMLFLRNVLLYFRKYPEKRGLIATLEENGKIVGKHISYNKLNVIDFLPAQWLHHAQIFSRKPNANKELVITDFFNENRKANPRTIEEFHQKYSQDFVVRYTFTIAREPKGMMDKLNQVTDEIRAKTRKIPPYIRRLDPDGFYILIVQHTLKVNVLLHRRGLLKSGMVLPPLQPPPAALPAPPPMEGSNAPARAPLNDITPAANKPADKS